MKLCKICKTPFIDLSKSNNKQYCSRKCRNRNHYLRKKARYERWYENVVCAWCGAENIEYHHVNPNNKNSLVSEMLNCSDKHIQEEINKCIPLCKKCHLKAHIELNNRTEHFCEVCGKKVVSKGHYVKKRCSDACRSALYRKNNREKLRLAKKKYREENKEKIAIAKKKYREENREKINKHKREYRRKKRKEKLIY